MPDFNAFFDDVKVEQVDPFDLASTFSMLVFGLAGTGKTSFAATASKVPALSPVLYIDLEAGTIPLVEHADMEHMTVLRPKDYLEFQSIIDKMVGASGDFPYRTVVIDTVDKLQEYIINYWESKSNDGFAKWAAAYERVLKTIDYLQHNSGLSVIALTHEKRDVLENIGELMVTPAFEGRQSGVKLPSIFDIIGRLTWIDHPNEEGVQIPCLTTRTSENIVVKSRFSTLPSELGNPTAAKIEGYVEEYVNKYLPNEGNNEEEEND